MKQLVCEMCGSTDLVKQEGVFVCQTCGCKYSVEEAKRMMVEGTVDVKGTVKIDKSDEIKNFIDLGYSAIRGGNGEQATLYANKALEVNSQSVDGWMIKMYAIEHLGTVGNPRFQEMIDAGNNAVKFAGTDYTVEEKVFGHYLDRCITLMKIATQNLQDTYNIKQIHNSNVRIDGWNASDRTANTDANTIAMYEGLAKLALQANLFVTEDALKRHKTLRTKLTQLGTEYNRETQVLNARYKIYGRYLLQSALSSRQNIINDMNSRVRKAESAAKKEAKQKYWAEHPDLKKQLEQKKIDANARIKELKNAIEAISGMKEKKEIEAQISRTEAELSALGLFKFKDKKAKQEEISNLKAKLADQDKVVAAPLKAYEDQIAAAEKTIRDADNELTRDRV